MKKYKLFSLTVLIFSGAVFMQSYAQSAYEAFKYGNTMSQSTARGIGIGGALGSIGGDISSITVNPAGIGVYRSSELTISPALQFSSMQSQYLNEAANANNSRFVLGSIGYVTTYAPRGEAYKNSKMKALSLGLTYNRVADFNEKQYFTGLNSESSITDIFSADAIAYGVNSDIQPPLGFFGYEGFLLYDDLSSIPRHTILDQGGALRQSREKRQIGGINEFGLTIGGNYNEKVLFGIGLNFLNYKYEHNYTFIEEDATGNNNNDFDHLVYNDDFESMGLGFNMKFGTTIIPNDNFRIGLAVHTPTWAAFEERAYYNLFTNTENLKYDTNQSSTNPNTNVSPDYPYDFNYNLRTPWRAVVSAAAILGKNGFITADYEFTDYTSMKYSGSGGNAAFFQEVNSVIKDYYQGAHSIRLGAEGRINQFFGRLGVGYMSNPFTDKTINNGEQMHYTAGFGYRSGGFGIDLGYMLLQRKQNEYAYPLLASNIPVGIVEMKQFKNMVALTLSMKF